MSKILFLNADKNMPRCAIFQAGKRYADAMRLCKDVELDYLEVSAGVEIPSPRPYDMVVVNYQDVTSQIIPTEFYSEAPLLAGFTYEARIDPGMSPMHTGDMMEDWFDIIMSPDPTLQSTPTVWGLPRVVPRYEAAPSRNETGSVIVSTFGFPSPWKMLADIVEMMNREFEHSLFRLNYSIGSWQEGTDLEKLAELQLEELWKTNRNGTALSLSQNYMEESELISWLAQSDLNVFMANPRRGEMTGGALLASADMAIAARKPILVSDTIEARHLKRFAFDSLSHAISAQSPIGIATATLYDEWSPEAFANAMDFHMERYL